MWWENLFFLFPLFENHHSVICKQILLAPAVQKVDSVIQQIDLYPVDSAIGFPNTYLLDCDLSGG